MRLTPALLALSLFLTSTLARAQNVYPLTPDSEKHQDVPQGKVESSKFSSARRSGAARSVIRLAVRPRGLDSRGSAPIPKPEAGHLRMGEPTP